jgi:hypothetical protein
MINKGLLPKSSMFMIHPGAGSCGVYAVLADKLKDYFNCYGLDSYNSFHENKIHNLHELSNYYLTQIEDIIVKNNSTIYHLLGWSLGGKIALEIACILEQKGIDKIKVCLLDTVLTDKYLESLGDDQDLEKRQNRFINFLSNEGCGAEYIQRMLPNISIEMSLGQQKLSNTLLHTKILLFKAMFPDQIIFEIMSNAQEISSYLTNLEYNNVDKVLKNKSNLTLVKINNVDHSNILNDTDLLAKNIISWNNLHCMYI